MSPQTLEEFVKLQGGVVEVELVYHGDREPNARWTASVTTFAAGQAKAQGDTGSGSATASNPGRAVENALAMYQAKPAVSP